MIASAIFALLLAAGETFAPGAGRSFALDTAVVAAPLASPSPTPTVGASAGPNSSMTPTPSSSGTPTPSSSRSPVPASSASPAANVSPNASAPATVEPSTLPSVIPSTSPSALPSPTATPVYKYKFVPQISATPALGAPQIFEVDLNDRQLTPHGRIQIRVVTTPDVVKVISRSGGREGTLTMVAPGEFVADGGLPGIPFIARGWKINIEFVATNAEGKTADVKVPVTLG